MDFKKFLEISRKKNGERFLPKSISLYTSTIERYANLFDDKNVSDIIEIMNNIIKKSWNPYIRSSFKQYLFFLGVQEDDERVLLLAKTKKRASALTSQRVLGEKVIPKKDLKILYDSVDDEWKLIIGVLYDTACRKSELLGIRWKDITFKKEGVISAEIRVLGKGSKIRTVFLTKQTTDLLKRLKVGLEKTDKVFVFRKENGELYKRQGKYLLDKFKKLTEQYLGKSYVIHSVRHSRATHIANNGGNVGGISNLLGHSSFSTTQIYIKSSSSMAKKMISNFSEDINDL